MVARCRKKKTVRKRTFQWAKNYDQSSNAGIKKIIIH